MKKLFFAVPALLLCTAALGGCKASNALMLQDGNVVSSPTLNDVVNAPTPETASVVSSVTAIDNDITVPDKLLAFRFDGYENMSVSEYRAKVIGLIAENEAEYLSLIESVSTNSAIQDMRFTNADAYFIANTLIPTIAENWRTQHFNNSSTNDNYMAEYTVNYSILDADNVTMGKRNQAISAIMEGIQEVLNVRTSEQLSDEAGTQAILNTKINELTEQFSNDNFQINVDLSYRTEITALYEQPSGQVFLEERGEVGTEADYNLLLSLKTGDYADKSVSDFLKSYTELAQNPDFGDAYERVSRDIASNDVRVDITHEEMSFIKTALEATSQEFIAMYQNGNELPTLRYRIEIQRCVTVNERDYRDPIVFEFFVDYSFVYSVQDDTGLTVGERDTVLLAAKNDIQSFIDNCTEEELTVGQTALDAEIKKLEQRYSNSEIKLSIDVINYQAHDQSADVQALQ